MDELLTTWLGLLEVAVVFFFCIVVSLTLSFSIVASISVVVRLIKELVKKFVSRR